MPALHHRMVRLALGCALAQLLALSMLTTAVAASYLVVPASVQARELEQPGVSVLRGLARQQRPKL